MRAIKDRFLNSLVIAYMWRICHVRDIMNKLDLYAIKDLVLETKKRVYSISELAMLLGKSEGTTRSYMNRLIKKNVANKVAIGHIAFTANEYIIANQLVEPSYISMNSALHYLGIILQVPYTVELICTKQIKQASSYNYYKINPKLFFGYIKEFVEGTYFFVAEPEKALIDLIYYNGYSELYLKDIISKLDVKKLKTYVKKYKIIKGYRAKRVLKIGDYIANQEKNIRIG